MRGLRGFVAAGLALIALETILSSSKATARAAGLPNLAAEVVRRLVDPTVPAIGAGHLTEPKPKPAEVLPVRNGVSGPWAPYPNPSTVPRPAYTPGGPGRGAGQ